MLNTNRLILPFCLLSAALLQAQPPDAAPAKPDSDAVKAMIEKARKRRGRNGLAKRTFSAKRRAPIARMTLRSSRLRFSTTYTPSATRERLRT